jgi:meso-butanediol dehydrogenase/(S,S)-butanediol dehydrogenase/diacetyl reductase
MTKLKGKVALITGAASGIGAACAQRLMKEGAQVAGMDVQKPLDEGLWGGDSMFLDTVDVREESSIVQAVAAVRERLGSIDVLINAAGVGGGFDVAHVLEQEDWDRTLDINLKGTWLVAKHVLPDMLERGAGSIVNVASVEGLEGFSGSLAYNASKGGVVLVTKNMALDYGKSGIRVNCVCPGLIETPLTQQIADIPEIQQQMVSWHALERAGKPAEVANAILFLASDEASFVTGHSLVVDGGWTAGRRLQL